MTSSSSPFLPVSSISPRWTRPSLGHVAIGLVLLAGASHCGKGAATAAPASSSVAASSSVTASAASLSMDAGGVTDDGGDDPMDAREADAWSRAADGGDDDGLRLADLVGCTGLRTRAAKPELRPTALRAMAFCRDFSELPWLADVGARGSDADALVALDAIVDQAAAVRRATDPEDADELHAGCAALLDLAKTSSRPVERRVRAVRALRMLSERGCVKRADIPTDVDVK